MAITRVKKGEVIDRLSKALKDASSVIFVNFKGLSVGNTTLLRRSLKSEGVAYTVAKKSLTKRALALRQFEGAEPTLPGELALAWGADLIAPAREVYAFHKKFPENLTILGGVLDGRYVGTAEILSMATIPPLQTLRGMFANVINSPIQRFAIALNEIAKKKA